MLLRGLLDDGGYRMGSISRDYVGQYEEAAQWMLRASQDGNKLGLLGKIGRCLARTVPHGLVPECSSRKCVTILSQTRITRLFHTTLNEMMLERYAFKSKPLVIPGIFRLRKRMADSLTVRILSTLNISGRLDMVLNMRHCLKNNVAIDLICSLVQLKSR